MTKLFIARGDFWYNIVLFTSNSIMKEIGNKIKAARKRLKLKQSELAKRLKMTSAQLCRIEGSKNTPSIKTLERIAKALDMTLTEMMGDNKTQGVSPADSSSDSSRQYGDKNSNQTNDGQLVSVRETGDSPDEINAIRKQVTQSILQYAELERELGISSATTLPIIFSYSEDERGAEILARSLRAACDVGSSPFSDLPATLESKHIRIVLVKTSPNIKSRSFYDVERHIIAIAINKSLSPERQIYRIAYELGYICIFGSMGFSTVVERSFTHKFVRRFASAFLMPEEAINEITTQLALGPSNWTFEMLLRLKYRFGVSAEAFANRLEKIGAISSALRKRFKEELRVYYEENGTREPPPAIKSLTTDSMLELLKLRTLHG